MYGELPPRPEGRTDEQIDADLALIVPALAGMEPGGMIYNLLSRLRDILVVWRYG